MCICLQKEFCCKNFNLVIPSTNICTYVFCYEMLTFFVKYIIRFIKSFTLFKLSTIYIRLSILFYSILTSLLASEILRNLVETPITCIYVKIEKKNKIRISSIPWKLLIFQKNRIDTKIVYLYSSPSNKCKIQ